MKNRLLAVALVLVALTSACASDNKDASSGSGSFPLSVEGSAGPIQLPKRPQRVVSLSPSATEALYAVGAGSQVVAVDSLSNFPAEAPRSSLSALTPNAEAVIAYKPDLVIVTSDSNGLVAALGKAQVPVLVEGAAKNLDEAYDQVLDIGIATDHRADAEKYVANMKVNIADAVDQAPKPRAGLSYYHELDSSYYTVTSASFIGQLYAMFGLQNVADAPAQGNPYPQLSAEAIVKADPDLVFLADAKCCGQSIETVSRRPGWSRLKAVTNDSVVPLDDDVASRWGPRVVELARAIGDAVTKHEARATR